MAPWLLLPLLAGGASAAVIDREGQLAASRRYRDGLLASLRHIEANPALFPAAKLAEPRTLSRAEREAVTSVWKTYLDYSLALDSIAKASQDWSRLKGADRETALVTFAVSTLGPYRAALQLIERLNNDPGFDKLLNEAIPELGLPSGTYAGSKLRYLHVARAAELAATSIALKAEGGAGHPDARAEVEDDLALLWKMGRGTGEAMTARNAFAVMQRTGFAAWLPVQAGVAEWMGDTKVWRRHASLVSKEQAAVLGGKLQPGDVLLERREWYLSNIGLPGFWPHAALIAGTAEERRSFFDDPDVRAWVASEGPGDGDFEALLGAREPAAYAAGRASHQGETLRVVEAVSEGVVFSSVEHSAAADSVAVLRPRLSKVDVARALLRAFHFHGRPYDFDFDFATDDALVCSELVVKCFPESFDFPVVAILGRKATPPNEIVRRFDETYGTPAQSFDLVAFLDGIEIKKTAVEAGVDAFRKSWRRPKWHIVTAR